MFGFGQRVYEKEHFTVIEKGSGSAVPRKFGIIATEPILLPCYSLLLLPIFFSPY